MTLKKGCAASRPVTSMIQKGPGNYSDRKVRETFQSARAAAEREDRRQAYLEELFALSQRLEKIQELSRDEMEEILDSLDPAMK